MKVVGRFAPSPSGRMHLGNVWSALLAWLSVRSAGGEMVLRMEDLDPDRCRPEYVSQLREDLLWLGLDWDREQPQQSIRTEAYAATFQGLQDQGLVYPCYCSRGDLHAASAPHASDGRVIYAGTCRNLSQAERQSKNKPPAWRLIAPDRDYAFTDGLQGFFSENLSRECGDFIIRRADGVYAYQLAVVTDDAAGGITQVVRGRDLLESTPRQMYLYELLGQQTPEFCHVPLLLAPDGRRLSKRERDLDLGALRERHTPEEILGFLASMARLVPPGETASAAELVPLFRWELVPAEDLSIPAGKWRKETNSADGNLYF